MYRITLTAKAKKELKNLKIVYQIAIAEAFEDLKENPFVSKLLIRELTGRYSYKMGVFRIIYTVNNKDNTIRILSLGHRKSVYR
jgi:mRNA interferase RelE/StbE